MFRVTDRIELSWLVTVRWTTIVACIAALMFGQSALHIETSLVIPAVALTVSTLSNLALLAASRRGRVLPARVPGMLVCSDVLVLAGCLMKSGGVLNPASIFFLVEIVLAALALGRPWTWGVTTLSVAGYGLQLVAPTSELAAAASMHPQISEHVRGMWGAFVVTAVMIGALVTRLALAIERRDRALDQFRNDAARQLRLMSLASMAAGAAHELSTPLGTIAVATGELARTASTIPGGDVLASDLELIRTELARSRRILTDLSGRADEGSNVIDVTPISAVMDLVIGAHAAADRQRVTVHGDQTIEVSWPTALVARALGNIVTNSLQASPDGLVDIRITHTDAARVRMAVVDTGAGMDADTLARAGDPFFSRRESPVGTGLGLFVARAIAEQLGGTVTLESAPQRGTTAELDLPRLAINEAGR